MAEHPIQGIMNVTMDKIRQMVDANTIIGKPITTEDGTTILPVSRRISGGLCSSIGSSLVVVLSLEPVLCFGCISSSTIHSV